MEPGRCVTVAGTADQGRHTWCSGWHFPSQLEPKPGEGLTPPHLHMGGQLHLTQRQQVPKTSVSSSITSLFACTSTRSRVKLILSPILLKQNWGFPGSARSCNQSWAGCYRQVKFHLLFLSAHSRALPISNRAQDSLQSTCLFLMVLSVNSPGVLAAFHCIEPKQGSSICRVIMCSDTGDHSTKVCLPPSPCPPCLPSESLFLTP